MGDKLTFGLIGCGRIGRRHAEQIQLKGRLVGVCDIDAGKADSFASTFDTAAFYDADEMLSANKFDVVVVCTPNGLHASHSIKSLNAGSHVLCEKPMAIKVADCQEMINASQTARKQLFIVKQNRYNPPVTALKRKLDAGALGNIFSLQLDCFWNRNADYYKDSWRGSLDMDGGTLYTQFSHFIDLLYWLFGDVKKIEAFTSNYNHKGIIEFEDTGVVIIEFESDIIGTINYTVNSFEKNMEGSVTVFGEKATVKIGGEYLNKVEYCRGISLDSADTGSTANDYGSYIGSMSNHDKVYDNLIDVLQNNAPVMTSSFEALKTVEIIERIYKAGRKSTNEQ